MDVKLWKMIFDTAPQEEIEYVLKKLKITIPGFRYNKGSKIQRTLIIPAITKGKKWVKVQTEYKNIIETNAGYNLKNDDIIRRDFIKLLLTGDELTSLEIEQMASKLGLYNGSPKERLKKNSTIEDDSIRSLEESKKIYRRLENGENSS